MARLFDTATSELGGLDALVNNAGIAGPTAACEDVALADWERTLAVNLTGQFLCAQRAIPLLQGERQREHRQPLLGGRPLRLSQSHALRRSRNGASSASPSRCRSSSAPSAFASTPSARVPSPGARIDHVFANKAALRGVAPDVVRDEALAKTSLRRLVTADDIANAIVFLASPLGANISGHALPVDADTHALV